MFSFKPIDHLGSSIRQFRRVWSLTAIFRDAAEGLHHHWLIIFNNNDDPMSIVSTSIGTATPFTNDTGVVMVVSLILMLMLMLHQAEALQACGSEHG
jgi:hypothetical protein